MRNSSLHAVRLLIPFHFSVAHGGNLKKDTKKEKGVEKVEKG